MGSFGSERKGSCERRCEKGRGLETFQEGVAQAPAAAALADGLRHLTREGASGPSPSFCLHWQVRAHGHDFLLVKGLDVLEAGYLFRFTVIGKMQSSEGKSTTSPSYCRLEEDLTWEVGIHIVDTVC